MQRGQEQGADDIKARVDSTSSPMGSEGNSHSDGMEETGSLVRKKEDGKKTELG
jgi:hypothetical protein